MLSLIELELKEKPLQTLCQTNKLFATGVLKTLCFTEFCLFKPEKSNNYSSMGFLFPLNTQEQFLNCVLDCIELLGEEQISLSMFNDNDKINGYSLFIKNSLVIDKLLFSSALETSWGRAGSIFVDFNKNNKEKEKITLINSFLFKTNIFEVVEKYSYLLL